MPNLRAHFPSLRPANTGVGCWEMRRENKKALLHFSQDACDKQLRSSLTDCGKLPRFPIDLHLLCDTYLPSQRIGAESR
jgi:hypothetical protein